MDLDTRKIPSIYLDLKKISGIFPTPITSRNLSEREKVLGISLPNFRDISKDVLNSNVVNFHDIAKVLNKDFLKS